LVLAVSTTPALLSRNASRSPFNLTPPIELYDLDDQALAELSSLHGLALEPAGLQTLRSLVGGHPYLARIAFSEAALRGTSVSAVLASDPQIFDDFLDSYRALLHENDELQQVLCTVAHTGNAVDSWQAEKLQHAGLIIRDSGNTYRLRYKLYERLIDG
jgi:hypothetical protein